MAHTQKKEVNQRRFLKAFESNYGNISEAAKAVGITRQAVYKWLANEPEFKERLDQTNPSEAIVDLAENALIERITAGDTTAIIFTLKTKGRSRGYIERKEITGPEGQPLFPRETLEMFEKAYESVNDVIEAQAVQ